MSVALSVRAKGIRLFDRGFAVLAHFGISPRKMEALLDTYCEVLASASAQGTLPITATVLERHLEVGRTLLERGIELAVHGLYHNDFALLDADEQIKQITAATGVFKDAGVPASGFRGPYLRSNDDTTAVLRDLGFLYECTHTVLFPVVDRAACQRGQRAALRRAVDLYRPQNALRVPVRPRARDGLIQIPVALPDDEMLIDRLGYDAAQIAAAWLMMLDRTYSARELFTLQLHPERIDRAEQALRAVLTRARSLEPKVWIARLDEIARWWKHRATLVLETAALSGGCYEVRILGGSDTDGASIVVLGREASGQRRRTTQRTIVVESDVRPFVGLSTRTDGSLQTFLREEGFPFEVSDDRDRYGAYLDLPSRVWDESDVLAAIDDERGPVVRLARWPHACQSALSVTGDIDSITLGDFAWRLWETWR